MRVGLGLDRVTVYGLACQHLFVEDGLASDVLRTRPDLDCVELLCPMHRVGPDHRQADLQNAQDRRGFRPCCCLLHLHYQGKSRQ